MKLNREIFREYDLRGIVKKDLSDDVVASIARGFGTYLQRISRGREIVVARDNRLSSEHLSRLVIEGLLSTGCDVTDIGEVPTPVFYFANHHFGENGGVMITASHNPPQFNGFKLVLERKSIYGKQIQDLREIVEKGMFKKGRGKLRKKNINNLYFKAIRDRIKLKRAISLVIDAGNGIAGPFALNLLKNLGCEVDPLYCESDGNFPHHPPDPVVAENLRDLIKRVKETKAELGIAYDGDGDRIGVVDEKGEIVWGDKLLIILAQEILQKLPGSVIIFDVKCSNALAEAIKEKGGTPLMWKTGHSLIEDKLRQEKSPLAGELSGHIYFADDWFGFDDALYTSARLLQILSRSKKEFSGHLSGIREYYASPEIRVSTPEARKFLIVDKIKRYFQSRYRISDIDGVKVFFKRGWGLVRASNTEASLVIRFEATTPGHLKEIEKIIMREVKKNLV
ncbi:MAG: phosphomannomutase/phosphoglucomutase [Candidatus Omnitrophica bacterium]|nr:phosphomannomutase/phosphoglucomutase [Candidatus Omnitrophota bacterium]